MFTQQIANRVEMPGLDEISIKAFFEDVWSEEIVKYQGKDERNRLTQYLTLLSEVALVEEVSYSSLRFSDEPWRHVVLHNMYVDTYSMYV